MKLPILEQKNLDNFPKFIEYWAQMYNVDADKPYDESINKKTFTDKDIQKLYEWKNGMPLSEKKQKSLNEKIISKLSVINELKQNFDKEIFRKEFKNISLVWKIFLLHIIEPQKFPIYDQHIHRAYQFICKKDWQSVSAQMNEKAKCEFYFQTYLPFVKSETKKHGLEIRNLDRGLFIFGKNLKGKKVSLPTQILTK
jgi:hypothetical protein